jgi:long-subunit fatty acid transport protein
MKFKIYFLVAIYTILLPAISYAGYKVVFTPKVSINGEYTDNVNLSDDTEESDYIGTISPGFDFEISKKIRGVKISYQPGYSEYAKHSKYNTWRHSAQFSGWTDISKRTKLELNDSFHLSEEPISEEDTTIRKDRKPYYTNTAGINLTHQLGKSDSISMGYVYSILENEDPDIEDNAKHNPSIGFSHRFSPYLDLDAQVSYTKGEFDIDDKTVESDDFDHWNGSLQLTNKFTKYLDGFVNYAHTHMDFKGESEDYQIYNPSIGMSYTIDEGTSLSLNVGYYYRDIENSKDNSGITVNGNIGKTRCLSGDISASYRTTEYLDIDPEREDRDTNAGLGLTFNSPARWWLPISVRLGYSYHSVDSSLSENDYEDQRVQFNISISKPFAKPIRLD